MIKWHLSEQALKEVIGFQLFDTTIGQCSISWSTQGVIRLQLPKRSRLDANQLTTPVVLPDWVRDAIRRIKDHLKGQNDDLRTIPLDLSGFSPFVKKIYRSSRKITPGTLVTYGHLAKMAGNPNGARACGSAMAKNPFPILVPCHRVCPATGGLGNFSAPGGTRTKKKLLEIEGFK